MHLGIGCKFRGPRFGMKEHIQVRQRMHTRSRWHTCTYTQRRVYTHDCASSIHPSMRLIFYVRPSIFRPPECVCFCLLSVLLSASRCSYTHTLSLTHTHLYSRDLILIKSARAHVWGTTSACTLVRPNACTQAPAHHTLTMPCRYIHGLLKLLEY